MNGKTRFTRLIPAVTLSATLLLAACNVAPRALRSGFMLALPRVEVAFDREGMPAIAGITPVLFERLTLGALRADSFRVEKGWVDYFSSTNVQHIELMQKDDGLYVWVNGKRLPNISYTAQEIDNLSTLSENARALQMIGVPENTASLIQRSLPVLRRLGLNLLLRFPRADGANAISARNVRQPTAPVARVAKQDAAGSVRVGLTYDEKGDPWLDGLTDQDFVDVFGVDVMTLALEPAFVADISQRGIREITVRSEAEGLALSINGQALPAMQCDAICLNNLGETVSRLNTYPETENLNESIRAMTPSLRDIDAEFVLRFPAPPATAAQSNDQPTH